jgi:signal transduction histidine kinase
METVKSKETAKWIKLLWFTLIIGAATTTGMFCSWRAPGLNLYAQDWLMRSRGNLPVPEDIVIVAIDEPSIAKLGRFPWSRNYTAQVLDLISAGRPKAIALDVLYSEQTDEVEDETLIEAIKKSGNVIVGEQLIEERADSDAGRSSWLRALPEIEEAAAGIGHVNVAAEQDGAAREMLLRLADDEGESRWALAVETIRVGDNLDASGISETNRFVRIGSRSLPFGATESNFPLKLDADSEITLNKPYRMTIDYIGPTGSFAARTYSFADVLENRISPERFRDKYVLIGATAATLGDRIATPFVHAETADGDQNGDLMPGVEILANSINTILRERFYQPLSDLVAALCAALAAFAVLILIRLAEGKFEAAKQLGGLIVLGALILLGCQFLYSYYLVIPPVVPMVVSFGVAAPLALLNRSLAASAGIDARIGELLAVEQSLLTNESERFYERDGGLANRRKRGIFPRGLEWKTQTLGLLSRKLIDRSLFVDRALRSLEEGLLIAETGGRITFANRRAAEILGIPERRLIGSDLFARIGEASNKAEGSEFFAKEIIVRSLIDRINIKREIIIGDSAQSHYTLHLSAVALPDEDAAGEPLGIVATLSDITHHRELQQIKSDVITLVTHELRTPLTAIQGMSEVLTEHDVEPEARQKMLATINNEAKRLARMINEYLDITRLESGIQKAHFTNVNITDLLEQTLLLLEPLAARREIKIARRFEPDPPLVFSDAGMLAQALTNVVGNAIKYSPRKTTITIETQTDDEMLKIDIADEGYGISEKQLPHIFEKFYRVPHRHTADVPGTGLGLALTRQIIELHGGRIEVESKLNAGSTFTVFLPLFSEFRNK